MMMYGGISDPEASFDTAVAQYVLDSGRSNYSLSALSNEYLHVTVEEEKDFMADNGQVDLFTDMTRAYMDYGFRICTAVMSLMEIQKNSVREEELENILYNIELPLVKVMASMEKEGFKADREELKRFGDILTEEIDRLTEEIHQMAGETFTLTRLFSWEIFSLKSWDFRRERRPREDIPPAPISSKESGKSILSCPPSSSTECWQS